MLSKTNLSNKILILISLLSVIYSTVIIVLYVKDIIQEQMLFIILLAIGVISFTSGTSGLFNRFITKKLNKKRMGPLLEFNETLIPDDFDKQKVNYGDVYLKVVDKTIYSVTFVQNPELLFSEDAGKTSLSHINMKKISKSVQFYLFAKKDEYLFNKIKNLNYQAKNFYIGSFIYDDLNKTIYQAEKCEVDAEFDDFIKNMYQYLHIVNAD